MLNVFLTVDTEISPGQTPVTPSTVPEMVNRDIYGITPNVELGLRYLVNTFSRHGLKAVFFVDALCADIVGYDVLDAVLTPIKQAGQEVQLHIHTEWLDCMDPAAFGGARGYTLAQFPEDRQAKLIQKGLEALRTCGVKDVCAFRAGNFGGSVELLRVLAHEGIVYDSSYNVDFNTTWQDLDTQPIIQPVWIGDVLEIPVTFFETQFLGHRPTQLCACSAAEMERALLEAWRNSYHSFVIVLHSFELIKRTASGAKPQRIVVSRLERLCSFLQANPDKFRTVGFSELQSNAVPILDLPPIRLPLYLAAGRLVEQAIKRIG